MNGLELKTNCFTFLSSGNLLSIPVKVLIPTRIGSTESTEVSRYVPYPAEVVLDESGVLESRLRNIVIEHINYLSLYLDLKILGVENAYDARSRCNLGSLYRNPCSWS